MAAMAGGTLKAVVSRVYRFLYWTGLVRPAFLALILLRGLRPRSLVSSFGFLLKGSPDGVPMPPFWLRAQVAGTIDANDFYQRGAVDARSISEILQRRRIPFPDLRAVLDFGCGSGRVIRHLRGMTQAQLFGSDQSAKLVDWCESHLPFATFTINRLEPPLDFPDDKFDFVYALSVFTHLPAALQDAWMAELHGVLVPGGHLLLSTHGQHQLSALSDEEKREFDAGQLIVKRPGSAGSNFCVTYHPESYVRDHLAKDFAVIDFIIDFIHRGATGTLHQDVYLLEKHLPSATTTPDAE